MLRQKSPLQRKSPLRCRPIETRVKPKRKCKVCGETFTPSGIASWCSVECGVVLAFKKLAKKEAEQAQVERKQDAVRREKLKTRSDYIKEAQRAFNAYVRARDHDQPCICCGAPLQMAYGATTGGSFDCGHYRSVGSAPHLRFDLRNAHGQRKVCNQYGAGRAVDYRIGLIKRRGVEVVEALEADQAPRKHDIEWLKRFIKIMRKKTRRLEKRRGK